MRRHHSKSHRKQHPQALENIQVREALTKLKKEWVLLDHVQRGDALKSLLLAGCTKRGLASDLGVDEGTIRRDLKIADLSEKDRAAIESGANPDHYLRDQRNWENDVDEIVRLVRESLDGSVSTELSNNILWFLGVHAPDQCLFMGNIKEILDEVCFRILIIGRKIYSPLWPLDNWLKPELLAMNCSSGIVHLSHECRPVHNPETSGLEELIHALLLFVSRQELQIYIQEEALVKAQQVFQRLTFDPDEKLMRKAKHMTPQGFAELISQRLTEQNLLPGNRRSLIA